MLFFLAKRSTIFKSLAECCFMRPECQWYFSVNILNVSIPKANLLSKHFRSKLILTVASIRTTTTSPKRSKVSPTAVKWLAHHIGILILLFSLFFKLLFGQKPPPAPWFFHPVNYSQSLHHWFLHKSWWFPHRSRSCIYFIWSPRRLAHKFGELIDRLTSSLVVSLHETESRS